jgi:hypothetical protein
MYGCETWSFTLREQRRLRVLENRVLRRIFGRMTDKGMGNGENYIMKSIMICTSPNIFRVTKSRRMRWVASSTYGGEKKCIENFGGEI